MATNDLIDEQSLAAGQLLPRRDVEMDPDGLLGQVVLNSFTATPQTIAPFGASSTLRWSVTAPAGVTFKLNNDRTVSTSGTLVVSPAVTSTYRLTAHVGPASRSLGPGVTVGVQTDACISATVPESLVRTQIRNAVDEADHTSNRFRQRTPARVEVDAQGIGVALRLVLAVNNFPDPDVDIDLVLGLRLRDGAVEIYIKSFAVDVDWPIWVTVVTAGASKIVEEFLDREIEQRIKPLLLLESKRALDAFVAQLPGNLRLHTLSLTQDAIRIMACPAGSGAMPFLVLPSPDA